jgi:GGDEF domain-containing protein
MLSLNREDLDQLERRELHLTILAVAFVLIQAVGLAAFMYPPVFDHPEDPRKWTLRVAYFGFCVLTLLFAGYLLDRQRTVRKLKQQVLLELDRNIELRQQANTDLLQSMPDVHHFWDRLTMEVRRALTDQHSLSVLLVQSVSAPNATANVSSAVWGDAAKALSRKLRATDSIYRLAPDLIGLILPEADTENAALIVFRLEEELKAVRAKHGSVFKLHVYNYPADAQSAHELEDIVKSFLPEQSDWAVEGSSAGNLRT